MRPPAGDRYAIDLATPLRPSARKKVNAAMFKIRFKTPSPGPEFIAADSPE